MISLLAPDSEGLPRASEAGLKLRRTSRPGDVHVGTLRCGCHERDRDRSGFWVQNPVLSPNKLLKYKEDSRRLFAAMQKSHRYSVMDTAMHTKFQLWRTDR